jgi:succinate dehydrogenase / fumarate reductase cytochrome b subunit
MIRLDRPRRGSAPRRPSARRRSRRLDPRGRHLGTWAFVANRLTGLGLVAYLYLHLAILSTLLRGPEAWDGLMALFRNPVFLAFDVLLVAGLAFHGFNGLRVALVGSGLLADRHKALLVAASILVAVVSLVAAVRIVLA